MHVIYDLFLFAVTFQLSWSEVDFTKVNFVQTFKDAEKNGGLTILEMQAVLEAHNTMRRSAANGKRERLPSAAGLPILQWDDRLAYEALSWANHLVKTKSFGHPSSLTLKPWGACGQNVGLFSNRNMFSLMKGFEVEIDFYNFEKDTCSPTGNFFTCGHAKQIYSEETTHVGCQARRNSTDPKSNLLTLVCNYGRIAHNKAPYTAGQPCTSCKGSYPFCLDGLCVSKKVCESAGLDKCKCTKKDSDCGNGASVDPATCQCTKNCPSMWLSTNCKNKCDNGDFDADTCSAFYATEADCQEALTSCAKHCGNCLKKENPIDVPAASNVFTLESYPRAENCEDVDKYKVLCESPDTTQGTCAGNVKIAAACPRSCNRCLMLDGVTNWIKECTPESVEKCKKSGLFRNACQKLCRGS